MSKLADDGPASVDFDEHFRTGLALRSPFALLCAGLTGMPDGRAAHIVVGVFWGAVAAGCAVLHTVLVDKRSASRAGFFVVLYEVLLAFMFIFGVLEGINDHDVLVTTLEVVPAAAAACALTYLVILLAAWVAALTGRSTAVAHPGPRRGPSGAGGRRAAGGLPRARAHGRGDRGSGQPRRGGGR